MKCCCHTVLDQIHGQASDVRESYGTHCELKSPAKGASDLDAQVLAGQVGIAIGAGGDAHTDLASADGAVRRHVRKLQQRVHNVADLGVCAQVLAGPAEAIVSRSGYADLHLPESVMMTL